MRLARIDWSSDSTFIVIGIFVLLVVFAAMLERATPKKRRPPRAGAIKNAPKRSDDLVI